MATPSSSKVIFILSLLLVSTLSTIADDLSATACNTCLPPKPKPKPKPCPSPPVIPPPKKACPKDTLKLGVCADLLGLVNVVVGTPPTSPCCALLDGLADLEVALCLCTAIKANILGINLNIPVALSLLVSACQKTVPPGFQCA